MRFVTIVKPGIIFGNLIAVCGGFFLASHQHFSFSLFLAALIGMAFVIASGCVLNNYIDRDIDQLMARTQKRVLAQGRMSHSIAIIYAVLLAIAGFVILALLTNPLSVLLAFIGLFFYVVVYSLWLKRRSTYGTLIGGIAGAIPPMVGYCAVTNRLDSGALIIFLILFLWQVPHFYAIAIYRLNDYRAAKLPILPLSKNVPYTKVSMLVYIAIFTLASVLPTVLGYTGKVYAASAIILGLIWLVLAIQGLTTQNDARWSRKMFLWSIINITLLCIMMAVKP